MKTIIVVYEGAADEPIKELDGRTPLQVSRARNATRLAQSGCAGLILPHRLRAPWQRVGVLAQACGLDRSRAQALRRGPVEAWNLKPPPKAGSYVFRGELITEDEEIIRNVDVVGLGLEETAELAEALNRTLGSQRCRIHAVAPGGLSIVSTDIGEDVVESMPASQILGQHLGEAMPRGRGYAPVRELMNKAAELLRGHPVNEVRVDLGENPANALWIWGGGHWPDSAPEGRAVRDGVMLSRSIEGRGLARMLGMETISLLDPLNANDEPWFRIPEVVSSMQRHDFMVADINAPLAGGRFGSPVEKVRQLDRMDQNLLGPLVEVLDAYRPYRLVLVAGCAISSVSGQPASISLPILVGGDELNADSVDRWDEQACTRGALGSMYLEEFMQRVWKS